MDLTRRTLISSVALAAGAWATPPAFELEEATAGDLQKRMNAGSLTAQSLTQAYLDRIAAIDKRGPALNTIIELNPDALAIAAALDAERKAKGARGPLHGIPILIKDNIDTADRMMTTAGSLALRGLHRGAGFGGGRAAARGRRRAAGQNQSQRMGQLPVEPLDQRLERSRRPYAQPLRARPQCLRLQLRIRRGRLGEPVRRWPSARKPMAPSCARLRPTAWSGSSRRSA